MGAKKTRTFRIPVVWEMCGIINVEAESIKDAIRMVSEDRDIEGVQFDLPDEQNYSEGSFVVCDGFTPEEIMEIFNEAMEQEVPEQVRGEERTP
jgi:hypothetical protein